MRGGIGEAASGPRRFIELTILGPDPSVFDPEPRDGLHRILRAKAQIPLQMVQRGPWARRFHDVDYGMVDQRLEPAFEFVWAGPGEPQDLFGGATDEELLNDRRFHAQNVFAIASRTPPTFEASVDGRRT